MVGCIRRGKVWRERRRWRRKFPYRGGRIEDSKVVAYENINYCTNKDHVRQRERER